jgi:predicted ATPase/class 3 adenylate cyclase
VKNYIPTYIQDRFLEGNTHGVIEAYTMFIDLSGFTSLTDNLMQLGNEGADKLSRILNHIFEPLVQLVYEEGGFIPYFAGDAFTAIFPLHGPRRVQAEHVLKTAALLANGYESRIPGTNGMDDIQTGIKIGISRGEVEWGIVGNKSKAFYFRGEPIDACAECQSKADQQQIVVDQTVSVDLSDEKLEKIEENYYRFLFKETASKELVESTDYPKIRREIARYFLPGELLEFGQANEFRPVVSVFINFDELPDHQSLDEFSTVVLDFVDVYSGYFKEIDFGDKGGVMVVFFGAPVSFENNTFRALEFSTELRSAIKQKEWKDSPRIRIGVTSGKAFTGVIGGRERCQYSAVGNYVNLAARLMVNADWDDILVDGEVKKEKQFKFRHKGDVTYKGFANSVPTYKLMGHRSNAVIFVNRLVGRQEELNLLIRFSQPLFSGEFAGVAFIFGEAGIGKSRLAFELKKKLEKQHAIKWFTCQSDQILRKSFNPFTYFLKNFFDQSPENSQETNRRNFERRYGDSLEEFMQIESPLANDYVSEFTRTMTILAGLVGIHYNHSLWEKLDAKGRYQNTLSAISNLLLLQAQVNPMVIELEDAHWFDEDSRHLIIELLKRARSLPILFLITSRYNEEGEKEMLVPTEWLQSQRIAYEEVDLNFFNLRSLRTFAEEKLGGAIHSDFLEMLQRTTNGNPFYLDQLIEYFAESDFLTYSDGKWLIKDKNISLSNSINAILTARIDRLSALVKETVKAAAVIGREFEVPVLNEVMQKQEVYIRENGNMGMVLRNQIHNAERVQIWQAINELRYIFKHSLLREAVYDMQLRTRLRELHRDIAEAIEKLYSENLEERFVDLAFHYEQADIRPKTIDYLEKSADYAKRNFQNQNAIRYYKKLMDYLDEENLEERTKTLLKLGRVQELIGDWKLCENTYRQALDLAKQTNDVVLRGRTNNSLGHFLMLKGDYDEAGEKLKIAAEYFEEGKDKIGAAKVSANLGNLYFRQGRYEEAKTCFIDSIDLANALGESISVAETAANLGLTYMNLGFYIEGIECQRTQLEYCRDAGDKQGMAILYTNLGIVYYEKGDYTSALECYEKGLDFARELGDKLLMAIATGSMGSVFQHRGDFGKAKDLFFQDLKICEELGDKQGIAIAYGLIGELYSVTGDFDEAITYLHKTLKISRELGYQKGIAKAINTLGDVANFLGQYAQSIAYYEEAVGIARKIDNKLVLGYSQVEKVIPLLKIGKIEEAEKAGEEARQVAQAIRNRDLLFHTRLVDGMILFHKGEEAEDYLKKLLREVRQDERKAELYYHLAKVNPQNSGYRLQALTYYDKLRRLTPTYKVKMRFDELNRS